MTDNVEEATKMTSREESTTSKLTMHSDVNMTDEVYTLHKDGQKADNLSSNLSARSLTSNSAGGAKVGRRAQRRGGKTSASYPACLLNASVVKPTMLSEYSVGNQNRQTSSHLIRQFWNAEEEEGDPHMNLTRRAMLFESGLVQHAVFQSPDHNTVHVIYGHTDIHFVRELTVELTIRTGLQLLPPKSFVKPSSSTADSVLIVIVDPRDSMASRLLREAVEITGDPDTSTLYIIRNHTSYWVSEEEEEEEILDLVHENVSRGTIMVYPISNIESFKQFPERKPFEVKRVAFWDNVCSMIGDLHMDPTRRAMLNEFGLVQHAVFQSPHHNTVHVICGRSNRHFVRSELTEELNKRTGLQLVPSQSRVATSSSTADSVLIVIVDRHNSVNERLLRQAMETSGSPHANSLFMQMGEYRPHWVEERLSDVTLMMYPTKMLAMPRTEDERPLFWENLSTIVGDPHMDLAHRAMLNEFGLVQHAVLQSPDHNTVHVIYGQTNRHFVHSELTEELKRRTGLQLVPPSSRVATSLSTTDTPID